MNLASNTGPLPASFQYTDLIFELAILAWRKELCFAPSPVHQRRNKAWNSVPLLLTSIATSA